MRECYINHIPEWLHAVLGDSNTVFTQLFHISLYQRPILSISWGLGCFHVCAGQWTLLRALSHLETNFSLPALSGSGCQQFRLCGTMVHFQCLSGCLCCLCVGLCHLVLIGLCPLCLWRHRRLQTPFLLHMVLRPVILINYIWKHHVVNIGYAAHHCILGDQMVSWLLRTCLQLMTFFSSETCCCTFAQRCQ